MINQSNTRRVTRIIALMLLATVAFAQAPVDDHGNRIGAYEPALEDPYADLVVGNEEIPLMSDVDLEVLVGPIALYPDDLLAIVLPASAYPLQLIDAGRFLEELENDSTLKPNPDWDDSIVALLNYPEVIELLNDDIDWTWRLGEAVVSQQGDVVSAIEIFRDRAYAAGNLKSDDYQDVTRSDGVIEITPVVEDVIYVPYYEPERVVVYQPRPVYYYYPRSYPVYYYPYTTAYEFDRGYFWGVTTAFTIGWMSDSLHVYHHSYHGHPYYGRSYRDRWWYRRPTMNVYNTTYVRNNDVTINRYYSGDRWRPRNDRRQYTRDDTTGHVRIARNRDYKRRATEPATRTRTVRRQEPIQFRERPARRSDTTRPRNTQGNTQRNDVRQRDVRQRQERTETVAHRRKDVRVAEPREQRRSPTSRQRQERPAPAARQTQERREPVRLARQETRGRVTPERRATGQARERAVPQRQASHQPRERAAPQRQANQQPRERAAPQRQAKRETKRETKHEARSEPQRNEKRRGSRERKARR